MCGKISMDLKTAAAIFCVMLQTHFPIAAVTNNDKYIDINTIMSIIVVISTAGSHKVGCVSLGPS